MLQEGKFNICHVQFKDDEVPTNYQWSGYSKNAEEFKKYNFLLVKEGNEHIYICSSDNGVGLGDYLSNYIFKQDYIDELESVYSPGCDYWFFQAWEKAEPWYEELDDWVQGIIEMLILRGYIARIDKEDTAFFVFSDLTQYEETAIPRELIEESKKICDKSLRHY